MDTGASGEPQALTIYTDASFSLGIGSWGAVIKGLETDLHMSGVFTGMCASSEQAELQAIATVLHKLARGGQLRDGASIRIYTDNRACDFALNGRGKFKRNREAMQLAMAVLRRVIAARQLTVKCGWIRGHQPLGASAHGDANRIADKLARAAHPTLPTKAQKNRATRNRSLARAGAHAREAPQTFAEKMDEMNSQAAQVQL